MSDETLQLSNGETRPRVLMAVVAPLIVIVLCAILIWSTGRAGLSALLTEYASRTQNIAAANTAASLKYQNPEAHYLRGLILENNNDLAGAITAYQQAIEARPDYCVFWLNLARVREFSGDTRGAIEAARQAVLLAPYYGETHWQLGNILLRAGQRDEAFRELRQAGESNPRLMFGIIDLVWRVSGQKAEVVKQAINPQTSDMKLLLAQYFRGQKQLDAALEMLEAAGEVPPREKRYMLAALIAARKFKEAYSLWNKWRGPVDGLVDPGFETEADLQEPGFGWRLPENAAGFALSLDPNNPRAGRSSLKVDFKGESNLAAPVVSQLAVIEPGSRYQLTFSVRTESIVSGGLPRVSVVNATDDYTLAESALFPPNSNGWTDHSIDFSTPADATAIRISLMRADCPTSPCPIFGRLWLDNISLRKL